MDKRLKVSDILKDGHSDLKVGKLDFNNPRVKEILANAKKKNVPPKDNPCNYLNNIGC